MTQESTLLAGIKAVAFDAVGTLINPAPAAPVVYESVGSRYGSRLSVSDIAIRFRSAFESEEMRDEALRWRTSPTREVERWRQIVASVFGDQIDLDACFRELWDHFARPDAWSCLSGIEMLPELSRASIRLAIASNFDSRLRSVIAGMPELQFSGPIVISAEVGWRKPASEFFAALCRALECEANEVLLVGDDYANDYAGAKAIGLRSVLLDPLGQAGPDVRAIRSLTDLVI